MLRLYKIASVLLLPFILVLMLYRLLIGKEQFSYRFLERFGIPTKPYFKKDTIWFHCASVGEANSIFPLIEKIEKELEDSKFLITTGTRSSAKLVSKRLMDKPNIAHQYIPVDSYFFVKLFLVFWKPKLALFAESELWPCLVTEAGASGCNIILINARISQKSTDSWKTKTSLLKQIVENINLVVAQSEFDRKRFIELGFKNIIRAENLKYSSKRIPANSKVFYDLTEKYGARRRILAASTSKGEEEILVKTYKDIIDKYPDILLTILPRHPDRANEIAKICKENDLRYSIRSKNQELERDTNIYIADTLGELGSFYRLHDIVFIGGSLNDRGGQNPIEPANLKCAIIVGNRVKNFAEIYEEFTDKNAVLMVSSQQELKEQMLKLISNFKIRKILINNSKLIVETKQNVASNYFEILKPYITKKETHVKDAQILA